MENPTYLGDAVYAYFDGNGIELRLNAHTEPCAVYLEPEVLGALHRFERQLQPKDKDQEIPPDVAILIQDKIDEQRRQLDFFKRASMIIASLPEAWKGRGTIYVSDITFFNLTREDAVALMSILKAGKWAKSPNSDNNAINYVGEVNGVRIELLNTEPPPSCHFIEEQVEIPAHTETVRRLVCK